MSSGDGGALGADPVAPRLWRTTGPDLLDLAGRERQPLLLGFSSWLDQLELPCQFLVCSRRSPVPELRPSLPRGPGPALTLGLTEHLKTQLRERPYHARQVFLILSGAEAEREARRLQETCGIGLEPGRPAPLAEGPWEERPSALRIGGLWLSSLLLVRLPAVDLEPGWLWSLLGVEAELDLSLSIRRCRPERADRGLRRRLRGLEARQLAGASPGRSEDPHLRDGLERAQRLRQQLATRQERLFEFRLSITVCTSGRPELVAVERELRSRVTALRGQLARSTFDQLPARGLTMPNPLPAGPCQLVTTSELAACWPWLDHPPQPRSRGCYLGRHRRTGAPHFLDLAGQGESSNSNLSLVAASGGGKSYLSALLALESLREGSVVVVLDPENEHRGWCERAGGEYLALPDPRAPGFNVLELDGPSGALSAALELANLLCGALSARESAALGDALGAQLASAAGATVVLGDCLAALRASEEGRPLAQRLSPWLEGDAGLLFGRRGKGPVVRGLLCIGLRELPGGWLPALTLVLSRWLWNWISHEPGPKLVLVDEAGLLSEVPELRRLLTTLARRVRKYQTSLVTVSQAASDLVSSVGGEVLAVNSGTLLLGGQHRAAAERLSGAFSLDRSQAEWLELAGRGQFLVVQGSRRVPIRVLAPDVHRSWIEAGLRQVPSGAPSGPQV